MPKLNFTESRDGEKRASTWVEFRVSKHDLAWSTARLAAEVVRKSGEPAEEVIQSLTAQQITTATRSDLWHMGHTEHDLSKDEEELREMAYAQVKALWPEI